MNWYITRLLKEAKGRKFRADDRVRYFTDNLKGKGRGIVLTPSFRRGKVVDFDTEARRYRVDNGEGIVNVHPRNLIPDNLSPPRIAPEVSSTPVVEPVVSLEPTMTEPFSS